MPVFRRQTRPLLSPRMSLMNHLSDRRGNMTISKVVTSLERDSHPPYLHEPYRSTVKRAPHWELVPLPQTLSELTAPVYGYDRIQPLDNDLTQNAAKNGAPLGERIIVVGRVLDENERPVRNALVEIWQANAAGRYLHHVDQHPAPLDPNFTGAGRCLTDENGEYRFVTIRPALHEEGRIVVGRERDYAARTVNHHHADHDEHQDDGQQRLVVIAFMNHQAL